MALMTYPGPYCRGIIIAACPAVPFKQAPLPIAESIGTFIDSRFLASCIIDKDAGLYCFAEGKSCIWLACILQLIHISVKTIRTLSFKRTGYLRRVAGASRQVKLHAITTESQQAFVSAISTIKLSIGEVGIDVRAGGVPTRRLL